ncbi:MAG: hypothetical protein U1E65_03715 [Myxococcota bacterium]
MLVQDNILIRKGLRELERRLPPRWSVVDASGTAIHDAVAQIRAPDRRVASLLITARARLDPKAVSHLADTSRRTASAEVALIVAPYLSASTRARLRDEEVAYLDLTGNIRIVIAEPGLFIEAQGASEDPNREERPPRSLRGPKAGRIVRALVDRKEAPGVRELAALTKIDAGYVSRVLRFLDLEALITRVGHGRIQSVDWPALLRRWAQEAPLESRGEMKTYLDPRGPSALVNRLANSDEKYVVTGSIAAAAFAPVAPTRLAAIWIRDADQAATRLGLRFTEAGANVLLVEPNDHDVFARAEERNGVWYASPSQIAVDLLTSPGRGPAEGEELIDWMMKHEEKWRR